MSRFLVPLLVLLAASQPVLAEIETEYTNAAAKGILWAVMAVVLGVIWSALRALWRATRPKIEKGIEVGKGVVAHAKDKIGFDDLSDIDNYQIVAEEMKNAPLDDGLWAKALALSSGDETAAKGRYIRLRVSQIKTEAACAKANLSLTVAPLSVSPKSLHIDEGA